MALFPRGPSSRRGGRERDPVWTDGYDVAAARDANRALALQEPPEDVAEVVDLDADGVRVRLFRPEEPTRACWCTCTAAASSSTTSTCTTGRAGGSRTGSAWRC